MTKAALILTSNDTIIRRFTLDPARPVRIAVDGGITISPAYIGWQSEDGVWRIVEIVEEGLEIPGEYFSKGEIAQSRDGDVITLTQRWTAWTQEEIDAYKAARAESIASRLDNAQDILRAVALIFNQRINAIFNAAANATSLADFKSRMATVAVAGGSMAPDELRAEVLKMVKR